MTKKVDSYLKYIPLLGVIALFIAGITSYNSVVAQTANNVRDVTEVKLEQKELEIRFDGIQTIVTQIETNQQNLKEDVTEIKSDIKLILKSLRGN
jgi:peptidoglycan hydrolase CwlO-like protein